MATTPLAITKNAESLRVLFNKIDEVYFLSTPNKLPSAITAIDMELPVLSDGVTFGTGDLTITKVKLTTGATWTSYSEVGDSDIKFNVATVDDSIVSLFFTKKGSTSVALGGTIDGKSYSGNGYGIEPKKCKCGILLCSEDKETVIYLPNVEMYGSLKYEDGKPVYIEASVMPLGAEFGSGDANNGSAFMVLKGA